MTYSATQEEKATSDWDKKDAIVTEKRKYTGLKKVNSKSFYHSWVVVFSLIICSFVAYYNKVYEQLELPEIELIVMQDGFDDLNFNL